MLSRLFLAVWCVAVAGVACSAGAPVKTDAGGEEPDASVADDAGLPVDAGQTDAGLTVDAGSNDAGQLSPDAGPAVVDLFPSGRDHLAVGSTFYFSSGAPVQLLSGPANNRNAPFLDESSGRFAFVPHLLGSYAFSHRGATVRLEVVEAAGVPFHNYNYYPVRAMAERGESVWVASIFSASVVEFDRTTLMARGSIGVGGWPTAVAVDAQRNQLVVAARADDSLTVVDLATRRATRSIWVGDEVADVVVSGDTAIATAPVDGEVVFIDLRTNRIRTRTKVGDDATYLALSADGTTVFAAGRRTGKAAVCRTCGADVSELEVATGAVRRTIEEVGTTLGGIALGADGGTLYVVGLRNNNEADAGSLSAPASKPFQHSVIRLDLTGSTITESTVVDLTGDVRPDDAGVSRTLVSLHSPTVVGNSLFVAAEAVNTVVELSLASLTEVAGVSVAGRPRSLMVDTRGQVFAVGHQATTLARLTTPILTASLGNDPRPADVADGQQFFTGIGAFQPVGPPAAMLGIAGNAWSCNSCHADGMSDRLEWQAGPVRTHRNPSRPFALLEGAWPLGWQGYLSDLRNYAYTVTGNIGIAFPTNAQVDPLNAYLASLMPPPAATSFTERNGGLSALAREGQNVFGRDCAGCHEAPLFTNHRRIAASVEDRQAADIPTLVGAYRNGTYYRSGSPRSLEAAVRDMVAWAQVQETEPETRALVRYVSELSGRDFFMVVAHPSQGKLTSGLMPLEVVFSQPVDLAPVNLARVALVDAVGTRIATRTEVVGARVRLTPIVPLAPGSPVSVRFDADFRSLFDRPLGQLTTYTWQTARASTLRFEGDYVLRVTQPRLGPPMMTPLPTTTIALTASPTAGLGGIVPIRVRYSPTLTWSGFTTVSGTVLQIPPLPIPAGGGLADGFSGFAGEMVDSNSDGIVDGVALGMNGMRNYTISGPGFEFSNMEWELTRAGP